jgi:dolichol-phosphate mannosyltransferase
MKVLVDLRSRYAKDLRDRKEVCRLVKFCLVGLSGVVVSVVSLWFFTDVAGLFYVISAILSHIFSVTNNFVWNQTWTFRDRSQVSRFSVVFRRWIRFLLTTGIAAGLFVGILTLLTEVFGLYYIASALCAIAVATPVNFLTSNYWVWRHHPEDSQSNVPKEH